MISVLVQDVKWREIYTENGEETVVTNAKIEDQRNKDENETK